MENDDRDPIEPEIKKPITGQEQYNLVTDLVTGPNLRWRDNLIQGVIVLIFALAGLVIGPMFFHGEVLLLGLVGGLVLGLLAGVLVSGIAIMIYRGVRHAQGKHD